MSLGAEAQLRAEDGWFRCDRHVMDVHAQVLSHDTQQSTLHLQAALRAGGWTVWRMADWYVGGEQYLGQASMVVAHGARVMSGVVWWAFLISEVILPGAAALDALANQ